MKTILGFAFIALSLFTSGWAGWVLGSCGVVLLAWNSLDGFRLVQKERELKAKLERIKQREDDIKRLNERSSR